MPFINDMLAAQQKAPGQGDTVPELVAGSAGADTKSAPLPGHRQSRFRFDVEAITARLQARIIGQPQALQAIRDILYLVSADMGLPHRPLVTVMMVGSTGVGKTETVRLLAEAIHGDINHFCRIDMNTLAQSHYSAALSGAPPGYVGSKEGHTLLDSELIAGSFSRPGIVLFDEIEKASDEVLRSLLNVMDNGMLQLTAGQKKIDFRNTIIFMTSNVGVQALHRHQQACGNGFRRWFMPASVKHRRGEEIINEALEDRFDPEFLNRLDRAIHYQSIEHDAVGQLLELELQRLNERLAKKQASLKLDSAARNHLTGHYDNRYGARDVARHVRRELEPQLARALVQHPECGRFVALMFDENLRVIPEP
ncbi:AAA domain-containing protein [Pseudomaricurvus sp. HS19]|nr:AAA domain-containing protein [Pseudomaricurvus sp. HS19]